MILHGNKKIVIKGEYSMSGKTVVITGASSGFGEIALKAFADQGYRVWGTMRDIKKRNANKKTELEAYSPLITIIDLEVTCDVSVKKCFNEILKAGPIDILINNAGVMYVGITEAYSVEQAHEIMDANYYGPIRTMQAVLPSMRKAKKGLIINCSTILGRVTAPFFGTYCASKHALEAYTQSLRYEVSPFGVDIAIVEPGPFPTNLLPANKAPTLDHTLDAYGELANAAQGVISYFSGFLKSADAPDPQLVVDAYLDLAKMPAGKRPTRTVAGIDWGVNQINAETQPIQDGILKGMQLDTVLKWPN